jgi:NADPH-dependent ferric siderophore reductase
VMERVDVQQLCDLLDKATPGPWELTARYGDMGDYIGMVNAGAMRVANVYDDEANAALIVSAVTSLPALLDRLDALKEVAEAADMIHAHGSGAPIRQPESCPLCAALARLREEERND